MDTDFNSRTSCEVRQLRRLRDYLWRHFNSRTSCEVRHPHVNAPTAQQNFNSRTSCEVRQANGAPVHADFPISTHAPLARCDVRRRASRCSGKFQLTHLLRGATGCDGCPAVLWHFNSRTSCEVRRRNRRKTMGVCYFNSRTSCEVRLARFRPLSAALYFNSRTSCEVRRRMRSRVTP